MGLSTLEESVLNNILRIIEQLRATGTKEVSSPCEVKFRRIDCQVVISAIEERKGFLIAKREEYNTKQRKELLEQKVEEAHAEIALQLTQYQGLYSSYKSLNLLGAALSQYRSEDDKKEFGTDDFSIVEVYQVMKHTFYSWTTLYALHLQTKENYSMKQAIQLAQKANAEKLQHSLQKSLDDYDPAKEAEYYAKQAELEKQEIIIGDSPAAPEASIQLEVAVQSTSEETLLQSNGNEGDLELHQPGMIIICAPSEPAKETQDSTSDSLENSIEIKLCGSSQSVDNGNC